MSEPGDGQGQVARASSRALSDEAYSTPQPAAKSSHAPSSRPRVQSRREGSATSPSPSLLPLPDPGPCSACRARNELDMELWAQRCQAEGEYSNRLNSLAESASLLDEALRLRVDEDSGQQGATDIQGALNRAIEDVTGALSRERLQRSALQAELRHAVDAYRSTMPMAEGMDLEAQALREELLAMRDTVDNLRADSHHAMQQLQAERGAFHSELHRITMHFAEERWQLVARLREQSAEIAMLRGQAANGAVLREQSAEIGMLREQAANGAMLRQ